MTTTHRMVLVLIAAEGLSVAACAPPTPKVELSIAVETIQREFLAPARDQDGLFRHTVSGVVWSL